MQLKSQKLILVGYESESGNYRLFDSRTGRVTISRNVIFNENLTSNTSEDHVRVSFETECDASENNHEQVQRIEPCGQKGVDAHDARTLEPLDNHDGEADVVSPPEILARVKVKGSRPTTNTRTLRNTICTRVKIYTRRDDTPVQPFTIRRVVTKMH